MQRYLFPAVLLFLILFLSTALGQEAQDLSDQCVIKATNQKMAFRLTDGRAEKAYEARKHAVNEIEFTLPEGQSAFGLYMIWKMDSAQAALDIYDPETETYSFFANVNNGKFVHEYIELPGAQRFRLRSLADSGSIPVTEVTVLGEGTLPERIAEMETLPRQIYVTVAAPDKQTYLKACRPKIKDGWERLMQPLELFPSLETRTVVRHTLVKGLNLMDPEGYAKLDRIADPDLIEPKGYVFVGGSRQRLTVDCMPEWELMNDFSRRLADLMGMDILREKKDSRVLLLGPEGMELNVRKAWENGLPRSPRIDRMTQAE